MVGKGWAAQFSSHFCLTLLTKSIMEILSTKNSSLGLVPVSIIDVWDWSHGYIFDIWDQIMEVIIWSQA